MARELADVLNQDCFCVTVNRESLQASLAAHLRDAGLSERLLDVNSHLFSNSPVFLDHTQLEEMQQVIGAVEQVVQNAAYRDAALATAANCRDFGTKGVFVGYDFHLGADGPRLIEINTNAGGVLLNLYLAAAQQACCDEVSEFFGGQSKFTDVESGLIAMFRAEWLLQFPTRALQTIAIVDRDPQTQFLYPEFLLFQSLFERHGIEAIIADPRELSINDGALWSGGRKIDLVYNRLTDFYLESPESACLRDAYLGGMASITPSPCTYALYGDKHNLSLLSDSNRLRGLGVNEAVIRILNRSLPETVTVSKDNASELWANRRQLFFKPATGHGSRGAYRGAKLTKRVWDEINSNDYVAQALVSPSERQLIVDGEKRLLKLDIRCVTYDGKIQQLSARLYRGQTTNLRTAGGGLATVFPTPDNSRFCR